MKIDVRFPIQPVKRSCHAALVMDHFGITGEPGELTIASGLELPIEPGELVSFTGPSGSGKSSLLRAVSQQLDGVVDVNTLDLGEEILVNGLGLPVEESLSLLGACGLGEARLLLRRPSELSDGQRYRYRLARAFALKPSWIVSDEFTAMLDRTLARVIAFNVHRMALKTGIGVLVATTHTDILEDFGPTLDVRCSLDHEVTWERHDRKKKVVSVSQENSRSPRGPVRTGRTSLGGIIEATTSVLSNG